MEIEDLTAIQAGCRHFFIVSSTFHTRRETCLQGQPDGSLNDFPLKATGLSTSHSIDQGTQISEPVHSVVDDGDWHLSFLKLHDLEFTSSGFCVMSL
jgi:hypothetical protein